MNYWWCNQQHCYEAERDAGVVQASMDMSRTTYRETVGEVVQGDLIVHYKSKVGVVALSKAQESGTYHDELPDLGGGYYGFGFRFATRYHALKRPIRKDDFVESLSLYVRKNYPLSANGSFKQGYFLSFDLPGYQVVLKAAREPIPPWLLPPAVK